MQSTLMQGGMDLMLYGMGTVFVFLTLLVFATAATSSLVQRFFPVDEPPRIPSREMPAKTPVPPDILKAIQAAIDRHRHRH